MQYEQSDNKVIIGQKDVMNYVFAIQTQAKMYDEIIVRARGQSISRAVDTVEISLDRFLKNWSKTEIQTGSEIRPEEDKAKRVSFIEIRLTKDKGRQNANTKRDNRLSEDYPG